MHLFEVLGKHLETRRVRMCPYRKEWLCLLSFVFKSLPNKVVKTRTFTQILSYDDYIDQTALRFDTILLFSKTHA